MILSCPKCSTRFLVDPGALAEKGRSVRCGACGHSWFQEPPADTAYEPAPLTLDDEVTSPLERDAPRGSGRKLWPRLVVVFLFVFVIAAILAGAYRYRERIAGSSELAARAYAMLGIEVGSRAPANTTTKSPETRTADGLIVPENSIKIERQSLNETPILVISGEIRNQSDNRQTVGRMRITLTDGAGKGLKTWTFAPEARTLEPGATMTFRSSISNPPAEAKKVRFDFVQE